MRGRIFVSIAVLVGALSWSPSSAGVLTQDPCPGKVLVADWNVLGNDVLENLLFAEGHLWISDQTAGTIRRFAPNHAELAGLTGVSGPGGLAVGPDGLIYAGFGDSIAPALLRTGAAGVLRFDPSNYPLKPETYASGLDMVNGLTFGPGGDLFVSNDVGPGPYRIPRSDQAHRPEPFGDVWGTNGLVVAPDERTLYAAVTFDQRSPIEAIDFAPGHAHHHAAQLSFGAASLEPNVYTDGDANAPVLGVKGLDDMTRDSDGTLYVVANGMGELLRVDPLTGESCAIATGLHNPSSVRITPYPEFRRGEDGITFYVTEFSGHIRYVWFVPSA